MDWKARLEKHLNKRPLVMARFDSDFCENLRETRHGLRRFTVTDRHGKLAEIKAPTLCVAELVKDGSTSCYLGVLKRKDAISTFDSRLSFLRLRRIGYESLGNLKSQLRDNRLAGFWDDKVTGLRSFIPLSPALSFRLIEIIAEQNETEVRGALDDLPGFVRLEGAAWEQKDAIEVAKNIFGLNAGDAPVDESDGYVDEFSETGASLLEDNVIAHDAREAPGYDLIQDSITGRMVFEKAGERLIIYTANRGPLERMLGVDLVYVNEARGNAVMVQYKMLEETRRRGSGPTDWVFRPNAQFEAEMARMILPRLDDVASDYRLNHAPFYFKFVKRRQAADSDQSFVISRDHLESILSERRRNRDTGGVKISYDALRGHYLREGDLVGLVRSGYIGTHHVETERLKEFLKALDRGERGVVLAWQQAVERRT